MTDDELEQLRADVREKRKEYEEKHDEELDIISEVGLIKQELDELEAALAEAEEEE